MPRLPVWIGVLLLATVAARAEPAEELYQRAFDAITFDDAGPLQDAIASDRPLPAGAVGMVEANVRAMELAVGAAHAEFGGWPLDESQGLLAEMPWIGEARPLGTLLAAGARYATERGDPVSAAELLAAELALAGRVGTSPTLTSELVEVGLVAQVHAACPPVLAGLDERSLQRLRRAVAESGIDMDMATAAEGVAGLTVAWLEGLDEDPAAEIAQMMGYDEAEVRRDFEAAGFDDPARRREAIEGVRRGYADVIAAASKPRGEREAAVAEVEAKLSDEAYGPLGALLVPQLGRAAEAADRGRVMLAQVDAAAAYRLDGEAGLRDVPDPATGEPFDLREEPSGGFTLAGGLEVDGEPITLTVGRPRAGR